jgi:hypothetical protein
MGFAWLLAGALSLGQVQPVPATGARPAGEARAVAGAPPAAPASQATPDPNCEDEEALARLIDAAVEQDERPLAADRRTIGALDERRAPTLTPELIRRVLEVARDVDPVLATRLRESLGRDPAAFRRAMQTSGRRLLAMAELKIQDPKLYETKLGELKIDADVSRTAQRLRAAIESGSTAEVERLRAELTKYVQIQVAFSFKARVEYYLRIEKHLKAMRAEMDAEMKDFPTTVQRRIDQLLAEEPPAGEVAWKRGD